MARQGLQIDGKSVMADIKIADLYAEMKVQTDVLNRQLSEIQRTANKSGDMAGQKFGRGFSNAVGKATRILARTAVAGLTAAFGGLTAAIAKSVLTSARFESMQLRLEQLLGSAEKAQEAFENLVQFGARTPFRLQEIIEATATLESFGAESQKLIPAIADLSVFMGVTLPEAASAFGRAFAGGAGAADIFRERGVLALIAAQAKIQDLSKLTLPQFREAMIKAITDPDGRVSGGTEKLAGTLEGRWSTFKDNLDIIFKGIGDELSGPLKTKLEEWIATLDKFIQSGQLESLAKRIQTVFATTLSFVESALKKLDELFGITIGGSIRQIENRIQELESSLSKGRKPLSVSGILLSMRTPESKKKELMQLQFALKLLRVEQERLNSAAEKGKNIPEVGGLGDLTTTDVENLAKRGIVAASPGEESTAVQRLSARVKPLPVKGTQQDKLTEVDVPTMVTEFEGLSAILEDSVGYLFDMSTQIGHMIAQGRNLGEVFKSILQQLAGSVLSGLIGGAIGAAVGGPGGFKVGFKSASGFATGGDMTVPGGYANDSYMVGLTSGEHVSVRTPAQMAQGDKYLKSLDMRLAMLNTNVVNLMSRQDVIEASNVVSDRGLELTVRKSERINSRLR